MLFAIPLSLLRRFSCAMETRHTPSERHRPTVLVAMHPERMAALARFPTREGHTATAGRIQATVKATRWEAVCARWRLSTANTESRTILSILMASQWLPISSQLPSVSHGPQRAPAQPLREGPPRACVATGARSPAPGELAVAVTTAGQCPPKTGTQRPVGAQRMDLGADLSGPPPRRVPQRPPSRGYPEGYAHPAACYGTTLAPIVTVIPLS